MKKIFFYLTMVASSLLFSCNEELEIATSAKELTPTISEFSPATGPVGTEIIIKGENLQKIEKAYINNKEVKIKSKVSGGYMTIEATSSANSGVIKLETSSEKSATSTDAFTYTYPTPSLAALPSTLKAGEEVIVNGENLHVVTKLFFVPSTTARSTAHEAQIIYQRSTELVFIVPIVPTADFKLQMNYAQATGEGSIQSSVVKLVNDGVTVNEDLNETYAVGRKIAVTGSGLATVSKVLIGDVEQRLLSFDATNLEFEVVDNPNLADGVHEAILTFVAGDKSEVIKENFKVEIPTFYKWAQREMGAKVSGCGFSFETGTPADIKTNFAELDPVAASKSGGACIATNQLDPSITDDQYYSVKPYMFMHYLGSGLYLYGPSTSNSRLNQFASSIGTTYGTPNVQFRTLDISNPAEKAVFDKITSGTFTNADFTPELINTFSLSGVGSDKRSNEITGAAKAYSTSSTDPRPWGGVDLKGPKEVQDYDPNTVVLVLYMKPSKAVWGDVEVNETSISKFGFIDFTRSNQNGHNSMLSFDVYWKRSAMK